MDFTFLKSNRFWALVIMAVTFVLGQEGVISQEIVTALEVILGGHVIVRTTDRFSETLADR